MKYYFSFDELTHTDTGISNSIPICETNPVLHNLIILRTVLNVIRGIMRCPIWINSGFRNREVNEAVGGVPFSNHTLGRAADISCDNLSELAFLCKCLREQEILAECVVHETYIHIAI